MIIQINNGHNLIIDDKDWDILKMVNWYASKNTTGTNKYYARGHDLFTGNKLTLHRFLLDAKDGELVDHINGNGLDNRRCNLRICTNQQNQYNREKNSNNTSGYKGVSWCNSNKKWKSYIWVDGRNKYLGQYDTPEDAYSSYKKASKQYHKEFSNDNKK